MQLKLKDNLPFTAITIRYQNAEVDIPGVLVDTGSASSIVSIDKVASIGIFPMPEDALHLIRGVGGTELVFRRKFDSLGIGDFHLPDFEIEVGGMDYGFEINGILGMDFLMRSRSVIHLDEMKLRFTK